jgi:hypothetical protein
MKCVGISLDIAAFILGVLAAWFWLKAARVEVKDPYPADNLSYRVKTSDFVFPTMRAFQENARLNKIAALLTGLAVLIGTLGNLATQWPLSDCSPN